MIFQDRTQAGLQLAKRLLAYQDCSPLVLALPRGGVPVAQPIADALHAPLDVLVARKIGAPGNEEFAIGAVTARCTRVLNERVLRHYMLPPGYLEAKTQEQKRVARDREEDLRGLRAAVELRDRTVILVDDGIATGMTMRAAIADVRARSPRTIIVAAPVIAPDTYNELQAVADDVVSLQVPTDFYAVGQFYATFPQVSDEEVRAILRGQPAAQS
jgi:putative phosphoribosyl transferase